MIRLITTVERLDSNVWDYHLPIEEKVALKFIDGSNKRVLCHINNRHKWPSALMKGAEYWFITLNKELLKKLDLKEGDEVELSLEKDNSEYGHEMPEELFILFSQDDEAFKLFKSLTMGKQRSLVYIVSKYKSPDSRLKKALAIAHHLKEVNGKLDFKKLNETIKLYNNQF